jgi:hypothetical protein
VEISSTIIIYKLCKNYLMNKITIPALLLGVVMIAGAFAFMPVQEASTVHTGATTTLAADAITAAKIADDAIIAANLATGALTADAFAADAIIAATLATGAIAADGIATDAIGAAELAADAATEIATAVALETLNPFLVQTAEVATASGGQRSATFTCTAGQTCVIYDATVAITAAPNATADIFYIESISINGVKMTGADFASPTNDEFIVPNTSTVLGSPADIVTSTTAASNVPASVISTLGATTGNSAYGAFTLAGGDTLVVVVQSSSGDTATSQITFHGSMTGSVAPATPAFA